MADIDLIPKQYVAQRLLRRRGRQLALVLVGVACVVGAARGALWIATSHEQQELARLRRNEHDSAETRTRVQRFEQEKSALEKQLKTLADLRARGRAAAVLHGLDGAHVAGIWLDEIRSFRSGAPDAAPAAQRAAAAAPTAAPAPLQQRVELVGHAVDHAHLAVFITRLSAQPAFSDIQLVDTSSRIYSVATIVDFKVVLVANDKLREATLAAAPGDPR